MQGTQSSDSDGQNYIAKLDHLAVIQLAGEERVKYLQGQVTADINKLTADKMQLACHCDFKGKMWSVLNILAWQDSILLITHQSVVAKTLAELNKYGVFAKVTITDVTEDWQLIGGAGAELEQQLATLSTELPNEHNQCITNSNGIIVSHITPQQRYLVLQPKNAAKKLDLSHCSNHKYWQVDQIKAGLGQIESNTSNEFIPQMLNLQMLNAIDFEKGCYMGQEVVARTKYLGRNKRAGFILQSDRCQQDLAGEQLEYQIGENWRPGGTIVNSAEDKTHTWAFAVLAKDTEIGSKFRVKSAPQITLVTQPLPYELE